MRIWRRLRLFQAGLIAGCVQATTIVVITPLVLLFAQYRDNDSSASDRDLTSSMMSLLPLFYVVLAARVALTRHRYYPSWDGPLLMLNTSQLARVALKIRGKYKGRLGEIAIWESKRTDNRRYREGEIFQSQSSASGESRVHYQRFTSEVDDGR